MTASVGESINWTLRGFHNPTGQDVTNFTIIDMPGVGLNFRQGSLPAFNNGAGITYEIRYMRAGDTAWRVHATGINAAAAHSFTLPQPGNLHYTAIGFFFGDVPANFALNNQITLTFVVGGNAPNNQLVNNFMMGFDNIEQDGNSPDIPIVVPPTTTSPTTTRPTAAPQTPSPTSRAATASPATTAAPTTSNPTHTSTTPPPPNNNNHTTIPNGNGNGYIVIDDDGVPLGQWVWNDQTNQWEFIDLNNQAPPSGAIDLGAMPQTGLMNHALWLASALFIALSASLGTLSYMKAKKRKRGGTL